MGCCLDNRAQPQLVILDVHRLKVMSFIHFEVETELGEIQIREGMAIRQTHELLGYELDIRVIQPVKDARYHKKLPALVADLGKASENVVRLVRLRHGASLC